MYNKNKHIHFVGIGGIGMSGIAELLINLGYKVSGSDLHGSPTVTRLISLGADIKMGHREEWINGCDVVVVSSAIHVENPEVVAAKRIGVPVIERAEMLAELMRLKRFGIAIAGSHGKTSTTSMLAWMMAEAELDPTILVGGKIDSLGGNAKLGDGEFLIAEADESDGSFLKLSPVLEVITNIDMEHLDYYRDLDHIKEKFIEFTDKIPFYGAVVLCRDDKNIFSIMDKVKKRKITYGLTNESDIYGEDLRIEEGKVEFQVIAFGKNKGSIVLPFPGKHNVYNALAVVAVGLEIAIPFELIASGIASFKGVQRRMQLKGTVENITIMDDYAHHPTEIKATLSALKETWPEKRLVVLFQPHRFTRTRDLFNEFTDSFKAADILVMTGIYAASESPIKGITTEKLLDAIDEPGIKQKVLINKVEKMAAKVMPMLINGDIVLTLGAGNITEVSDELMYLFSEKNALLAEYRE